MVCMAAHEEAGAVLNSSREMTPSWFLSRELNREESEAAWCRRQAAEAAEVEAEAWDEAVASRDWTVDATFV